MTDHYDRAIELARQNLADARARASTDFMAEFEVEQITQSLVDLEREAAIWRSKTPEERAADDAAREAKWEAFEAACTDDEDEDDEDEEI